MITPSRQQRCCNFIASLTQVDLNKAEDWLKGALNTSRGQGYPEGSKVAPSTLSIERFNRIASDLIFELRHQPVAGQSTFDRLFFENAARIIGNANLGTDSVLFSFGRAQKFLTIFLKYCYAWYWCKGTPSPAYGPIDWVKNWSPFLHVPVDQQTLRHLVGIGTAEAACLALSGTSIVSWLRLLEPTRYCRIQDAVRSLAIRGGYEDPMHYELDRIWPKPPGPAGSAAPTDSRSI